MLTSLAAAAVSCSADGRGEGDRSVPASEATIVLGSPAFADGEKLPERYAAADGVTPPLRWSGLPRGTRSVAVLMEDVDVATSEPVAHWLIYNLPPDASGLPENVPPYGTLAAPAGALQGRNWKLELGYTGPEPPPGDGPHRYRFQVFALDEPFPDRPGVTRAEFVRTTSGHVLGRGELTATYERK